MLKSHIGKFDIKQLSLAKLDFINLSPRNNHRSARTFQSSWLTRPEEAQELVEADSAPEAEIAGVDEEVADEEGDVEEEENPKKKNGSL